MTIKSSHPIINTVITEHTIIDQNESKEKVTEEK
jgi:hypothetical protein